MPRITSQLEPFQHQRNFIMNTIHLGTPRRWSGIAVLLALYAGLPRMETTAQEPLRPTVDAGQKKHGSDVTDTAELFDIDAVRAARKELERIEHEKGVPTVIQTVESLRGKKIAEVALHAARESGIQGIYVLIARNEKEIELLVSKKYFATLTGPRQAAIRGALSKGSKSGILTKD